MLDHRAGPSPTEAAELLIETPNLRVRRVRRPSPACVVTFANYAESPSLDQPGFGESYLARYGIDAIHIVGRGNDWYQYPDMPPVLAAVRDAARGSQRVVTYGSSMGGYAAIRFAGEVGADLAVALSPQFSLDPTEAPFEHRWQAEARRIRFGPHPTHRRGPPAVIIHDAHGADSQHAKKLATVYPVTAAAIPHCGHPSGTFLAETGLLTSAIADILAGRFDPADLLREARARRRRSGKYLSTLSERQPQSRRRLKIALARLAQRTVTDTPYYASRLAGLLYRAGALEEAEALHRQALDMDPSDALLIYRLSLFLRRLSRFSEALELAVRAVAADPASAGLRRHLAQLVQETTPANPAGLAWRLHDVATHRLTLLAWQRGWRLFGRIERP